MVLLALSVLGPIALTVLICFAASKSDIQDEDLLSLVLAGTAVGSILAGVLGVLIIGQEYRHSTIRVTFTSEPRRARVMVAKVVTITAATVVAGAVAAGVSYVIGNAILTSRGLDIRIDGTTQLRAVVGVVILYGLYALAGLGLGSIIRATAGAITLFVVWPLVIEPIIGALISPTHKYLPFIAASALIDTDRPRPHDVFTPWVGALWFAAFVALLLVIGTVLVWRRDA
jgi:ABC-type transport system involved in multi-copper enzyme maturation permease subunit